MTVDIINGLFALITVGLGMGLIYYSVLAILDDIGRLDDG